MGVGELDLAIEAPGEPPEYLRGLVLGEPDDDGADPLQRQVERRSVLVRLIPDGSPIQPAASSPSRLDWLLVLKGGSDGAASDSANYVAALLQLNDEPEVALLALPDLFRDLADVQPPALLDVDEVLAKAQPLLTELLAQIDASRDRLLLLDAPRDPASQTALCSAGLVDLAQHAAWRPAQPRMPLGCRLPSVARRARSAGRCGRSAEGRSQRPRRRSHRRTEPRARPALHAGQRAAG